jgi:hypothetical protein
MVMRWVAVTEGVTNPTRALKMKLEWAKARTFLLLIFLNRFEMFQNMREENISIIRISKALLEFFALGS